MLGRRGFSLECAGFAVREEHGSPPTSSCGDMDLAAFNSLDNRRLEVVADGLTLWHGAQ